jgi:hypothetical protein
MGHATAEAVVRAGLQLVPVSFTGASEAVAVGNVGVSGVPVELVAPEERQSAMDKVKGQYPGLVLIDFTLPSVVNGASHSCLKLPAICNLVYIDQPKNLLICSHHIPSAEPAKHFLLTKSV